MSEFKRVLRLTSLSFWKTLASITPPIPKMPRDFIAWMVFIMGLYFVPFSFRSEMIFCEALLAKSQIEAPRYVLQSFLMVFELAKLITLNGVVVYGFVFFISEGRKMEGGRFGLLFGKVVLIFIVFYGFSAYCSIHGGGIKYAQRQEKQNEHSLSAKLDVRNDALEASLQNVQSVLAKDALLLADIQHTIEDKMLKLDSLRSGYHNAKEWLAKHNLNSQIQPMKKDLAWSRNQMKSVEERIASNQAKEAMLMDKLVVWSETSFNHNANLEAKAKMELAKAERSGKQTYMGLELLSGFFLMLCCLIDRNSKRRAAEIIKVECIEEANENASVIESLAESQQIIDVAKSMVEKDRDNVEEKVAEARLKQASNKLEKAERQIDLQETLGEIEKKTEVLHTEGIRPMPFRVARDSAPLVVPEHRSEEVQCTTCLSSLQPKKPKLESIANFDPAKVDGDIDLWMKHQDVLYPFLKEDALRIMEGELNIYRLHKQYLEEDKKELLPHGKARPRKNLIKKYLDRLAIKEVAA